LITDESLEFPTENIKKFLAIFCLYYVVRILRIQSRDILS
jgi:NAD/NADP transhydrogenase alpha subunit